MTRLSILTTQRSGSRWLIDMLSTVPGGFVKSEVFLERAPGGWRGGAPDGPQVFHPRYYEFKTQHGRRAVGRYLDLIERSAADARFLCFKVMYDQIRRNPRILVEWRRRGYKVLHLVRRNSVEVALSLAVIEATGQAHASEGEALVERTITLEPHRVIDKARRIRRRQARWSRLVRLLLRESMEVDYEGIVRDAPARLREIEAFCGLPAGSVSGESSQRKLGGARYAGMITNYEEILEAARRAHLA